MWVAPVCRSGHLRCFLRFLSKSEAFFFRTLSVAVGPLDVDHSGGRAR